jgi:pyruvate kinase
MLNNIILKAEEDPKTKILKGDTASEEKGTDSAIIASAVRSAVELHSPCILCMVSLGSTTANVSKFKANVPTIAITDSPHIARKCIIYRGIFPLVQEPELVSTIELLKEWDYVKQNDFLILLSEICEVSTYSQRMGVLRVE